MERERVFARNTANRHAMAPVTGGTAAEGRERSLSGLVLRNSFFILLARGIQIVSGFFVAIAVARYLSIRAYGEYSFMLAYVSSIMALAYFGIQQVLIREVAKGGVPPGNVLGAAVQLRTSLSVVAMAAILASFLFMDLPRPLMEAGAVAAISELFLSFSMLSKATFQAFEKMVYEPIVTVVYSAALLISVSAAVYFDMGFLWIFIALAAANLAQLSASSYILSRKFVLPVLSFDKALFSHFFKDALVIGIGIFFYQNLFKIGVLMLKWLGSVGDVSYFSAPHNLVMQLQVVPASLTMAVFPVFSRLMHSDRERMAVIYEKIFRAMLVFSAFAAVCLSLFSREVIAVVFGSKFDQSAAALAVVAWAMVPLTLDMLLNGVLIAMNKQKYSVIYAGAALAVNVLASLIFIPEHGFMAASCIAVFTYLFLFLCSQYFVSRNGLSVSIGKTVLKTAAAVAAAAAAILLVKPFSAIAALAAGTVAFFLVIKASGAFTAREILLIKESLLAARREKQS